MRIAYIAPYQGPALLKKRPVLLNLSLAGNLKIELVAELLQKSGHDVEILSQGEVVERRAQFYPGFSEPGPVQVNVYYSSALPIRSVNGFWSTLRTLQLFKERHRAVPYDLVIVYNLKLPQVACARFAIRRLGLPVVLEYEDDAFVDVTGKAKNGFKSGFYFSLAERILNSVSACTGASPHLLSRLPASTPKLVLRGIVGDDLINAARQANGTRKNWVVFSGTHYRSKGIEQLIKAWGMLDLPGWELHIAGRGELTATLQTMALGFKNVVFHGLLSRQDLVRLLCSAKICVNPHVVSQTPGNVFAFKIIEYLAAGAHVVTTPMGALEKETERGITYMPNNDAATIASTLTTVIQNRTWEQRAAGYVSDAYGPDAVSRSLNALITRVTNN